MQAVENGSLSMAFTNDMEQRLTPRLMRTLPAFNGHGDDAHFRYGGLSVIEAMAITIFGNPGNAVDQSRLANGRRGVENPPSTGILMPIAPADADGMVKAIHNDASPRQRMRTHTSG